jgi:hypothetical protein
MPIPAVAMTPIPPSSATADASPEREIPTPIPPWIMGILATESPIFSTGSVTNLLFQRLGRNRPFSMTGPLVREH